MIGSLGLISPSSAAWLEDEARGERLANVLRIIDHVYLMNRPYRPVRTYVSTTVDVLLTTAILFADHECGGYATTLHPRS